MKTLFEMEALSPRPMSELSSNETLRSHHPLWPLCKPHRRKIQVPNIFHRANVFYTKQTFVSPHFMLCECSRDDLEQIIVLSNVWINWSTTDERKLKQIFYYVKKLNLLEVLPRTFLYSNRFWFDRCVESKIIIFSIMIFLLKLIFKITFCFLYLFYLMKQWLFISESSFMCVSVKLRQTMVVSRRCVNVFLELISSGIHEIISVYSSHLYDVSLLNVWNCSRSTHLNVL